MMTAAPRRVTIAPVMYGLMPILVFYQCGDGIRLYGAADAEGGEGGKEGEEDTEPLPSQSLFEGIHRTAKHLSTLGLDAVFHGKKTFGILGGDTEDTGEPAPEYGAWSTQGDGSGHTYDITGTDGRGKGCGEGSELGDIASGILVLLEGQRYRLENLTLWKVKANRQENVGSQQQDDHRPPPKERTEGCEKFVDCFHVNLSF